MSLVGTKLLRNVGQSMSALPGYFRHQLVPLSRSRHRPRYKISDRTFDLGMAEQELDGSQAQKVTLPSGGEDARRPICDGYCAAISFPKTAPASGGQAL